MADEVKVGIVVEDKTGPGIASAKRNIEGLGKGAESLVIALCLGLLLTYLTVIVAAWRIARLNVVAAVRNLPDEGPPPPSLKRYNCRFGRTADRRARHGSLVAP